MSEKYIIDGMATVVVCPIDGKDKKVFLSFLHIKYEIKGLQRSDWDKFDEKVEKRVKDIIDKLKQSHTKFEDPDFGPTGKDEFGAVSFYGNGKPDPAGSKYPAPETLKWERPRYDDKIFSESNRSKDIAEEGEVEVIEDSQLENDDDEDSGLVDDEEDDYGFGFAKDDDQVSMYLFS